MPDIDTSPAALRALADGLNPVAGMIWVDHDHQLQIAATLRAIAAEKEAATKSHDPNRAGIAQATAMARNDIRRAFDRDEITAEDYRRMNDELDKSAGIVRAAPKPPMSAAEKEASDRVPGCEAPARVLAEWLGYAWDGLHDRDISNRYPDWVYDDIGGKKFQGGRPALRRVAQAMLAAATVKPDLTVGGADASLDVRSEAPDFLSELQSFASMCERSLSVEDGPMLAAKFRDAAFCISIAAKQAAADRATLQTLRASLAAAEQKRDEALRDAIEFTQKVDAGLVRDEEYLRLHREKMEQYDRRVAAEARAEKAEAALWAFSERLDREVAALAEREADRG